MSKLSFIFMTTLAVSCTSIMQEPKIENIETLKTTDLEDVIENSEDSDDSAFNALRFCSDSIYGQYLNQKYRSKAKEDLRYVKGWRKRKSFKRNIKHTVRHQAKTALDHSSENLPKLTFPVVRNSKVDRWIHYFETDGRSTFMKWLVRKENFKGILLPLLEENGLPRELIFLAMIESGFNNKAYSRARATGTWQFMSGTARLYGLKVNYWLDERRDPVKATAAAANYLKDLYTSFGDWYLAMASYNAGPGRINRAIRRLKTRDFWKIAESRYIRSETKNYVPKMLAALHIASNPTKYGFHYKPSAHDYTPKAVVNISRPVRLSDIADSLNIPRTYLRKWNPELVKGITPPLHRVGGQPYQLRIPARYVDQFPKLEPTLAHLEIKDVKMHRIKRGETLTHIARRYKVSLRKILRMNPKIHPRRLKPGKRIAIPIPAVITKANSKTA